MDSLICGLTHEEFLERITAFHNYPAPGLILGGFMVDLARRGLPEGTLFEALCETGACLPDAVQLFTPCTLGNGWLRLEDLGRYALTLYDKHTGQGFRVWLDPAKLGPWPEIAGWFLKLKPKKDQDSDRLRQEIFQAGEAILSVAPAQVGPEHVGKRSKGSIAVCARCGEAYPARHGELCLGCSGKAPARMALAGATQHAPEVTNASRDEGVPGGGPRPGPRLAAVPVAQAVGRRALHDMTEILPGQSKGPAVVRGQIITPGDLCRLQRMGRLEVYVEDEDGPDPAASGYVHEDQAALEMVRALCPGAGLPGGLPEAPENGLREDPGATSENGPVPAVRQGQARQRDAAPETAPSGGRNAPPADGSFPVWPHGQEAAGDCGVVPAGPPREGKITLTAARDGLFWVDEERLAELNMLAEVALATRHAGALVKAGEPLGGVRAIPLFVGRDLLDRAVALCRGGQARGGSAAANDPAPPARPDVGPASWPAFADPDATPLPGAGPDGAPGGMPEAWRPLLEVRPLRRARAGALITGTEVFTGLVEDRFAPILAAKLEALGSQLAEVRFAPDEALAIARGLGELLDAGCDLILTTAGMSVDPGDVTRKGLDMAGLTEALFGMPVLPGNMTLIGQVARHRGDAETDHVPVLGVPACALFHAVTSLDLLLPLVLAGVPITRPMLARMGHGGFCRDCARCSFPHCPFGK